MPHVIVKLWPGRNDEIKSNLAKRIAHTVAGELKVDMGDKLVGKKAETEEVQNHGHKGNGF